MSLIRLRGGTEYEWDTADPVLRDREAGVTTDTHRIKIGDGYLPWSLLPWSDASGQSIIAAVAVVDEDYEADPDDHVIIAAAACEVSLPTALGRLGKTLTVKSTAAGAVAVTGTEPIDDATTQTLNRWESITVISDGSQWVIV